MIWSFDYSSVSSISKLLEANGLGMTKKFGQNFLISMPAIDRIVSLCGANQGSSVWEVGPGIGALTTRLLHTGAQVTSFEIDHGFCRILREQAYIEEPRFTLIEGDVLKTWKGVRERAGTPDIVCANLPYNVGSVFIASLIENRCLPEIMVFTLQAEVVSRICARQGDDAFSGFSILTGMDYENSEAFRLKAGCFFPSPNVDSSVVVMKKKKMPLVPEEFAAGFIGMVRLLFSRRRKTVKNNLKSTGLSSSELDSVLLKSKIALNDRAENLDTEQILELVKNIHYSHKS